MRSQHLAAFVEMAQIAAAVVQAGVAGAALFDRPSPGIHSIDVAAPEGYAASVALAAEPRMMIIQHISVPEVGTV